MKNKKSLVLMVCLFILLFSGFFYLSYSNNKEKKIGVKESITDAELIVKFNIY